MVQRGAGIRTRRVTRRLVLRRLALGVAWDVLREMAENELADEVVDRLIAELDDYIVEDEMTGVRVRMIGARNKSGAGVAEQTGVGRLEAQIVAALDDGRRDRVPGAARNTAIGHHKVARVLPEERCQRDGAQHAADHGIA